MTPGYEPTDWRNLFQVITMQLTKVLSILAAVILSILAFGLYVAQANTPERAIPATDATSPSAGAIRVTWELPSDTGHLALLPGVLGAVGKWMDILHGAQLGHRRQRLSRRARFVLHDNGPGARRVRGRGARQVRRLSKRRVHSVRQGNGGGGLNAGGTHARSYPGGYAAAHAGSHAAAHAGSHAGADSRTHAGADSRSHAGADSRSHTGTDSRSHAGADSRSPHRNPRRSWRCCRRAP